jgi:hypothetical protein
MKYLGFILLGAVIGGGLVYRFRHAVEKGVAAVAGLVRRIRGNAAP